MNIGNKIIELRKKRNLTQEKLADRVGVSRQTLSSWESNVTSPNLEQAFFLCSELNISLDDLVDNRLDIVCKNKDSILKNLIGKSCELEFDDYYFDGEKLVSVLDVNNDFITIEYKKNKKIYKKLIDVSLITSIKVLEED